MLAPVIEEKKDEIAEVCRKHRIQALWVFGSATNDRFDPATSDVDVLVDLGEYSSDYASRFFGTMHELEEILDRPVDLLTVNSLSNPYFREEVEETRVLVYGSPDTEAAA